MKVKNNTQKRLYFFFYRQLYFPLWFVLLSERGVLSLQNNVTVHCVKLDINQQQLGLLVEVSRQMISLIERGGYNPSILLALKLRKYLSVR